MTYIDVFQRQVEATPDKPALTFVTEGEHVAAERTYVELSRRVRAVAHELARHFGPGDRLLLLYPPGVDFFEGFLGCLFAGVIAVPMQLPAPSRLREAIPRLLATVRSASPAGILVPSDLRPQAEFVMGQYDEADLLRWIHTESIETRGHARWTRPPGIDARSIAFLQYTSGSTGQPKGAMVTHGNLVANTAMINDAFALGEADTICHWLPTYHDMGLIGHGLAPLRAGSRVVFMAPWDFLLRPVRWLQAIARFRGTGAAAPNFAYDLCARRVSDQDKAALDLSSWTRALNGAEPINASTLTRFADAFAQCGFRVSSFRPCYGLAEATLLVSGRPAADEPAFYDVDREQLAHHRVARLPKGDPRSVRVVASGDVVEPGSVRIIDPVTREPVGSDAVGEIWVSNDSVVAGYWHDDHATNESLNARLPSGAGPYLRTGDLGFLDAEHLVVTGRIKDLIIRHGVNYYPQDIERSAEEIRGARRGGTAAFAVAVEDEEALVIVVEFERRARAAEPVSIDRRQPDDPLEPPASVLQGGPPPMDGLMAQMAEHITRQHGLPVHDVVLVPPGSIPKTSSGKTRRRAARALYLEGALTRLASLRPTPTKS